MQQSLQTSIDQLPFTSAHVFDPASRMTSVRQLAILIDGIRLGEVLLVRAYRENLPVLRAAANLD